MTLLLGSPSRGALSVVTDNSQPARFMPSAAGKMQNLGSHHMKCNYASGSQKRKKRKEEEDKNKIVVSDTLHWIK